MNNCTFDKGDKCTALNARNCEGCAFRKTKEELNEGREKAKAMLDRLPKEQYEAIKNKYYGRDSVNHGII